MGFVVSVPSTHIYFGIAVFPEEQLVGAIKLKAMELGGAIQPMTPEKRHKQHEANQKYEAAKKHFYSNGLPIMAAEVKAVFESIDKQIQKFRKPVGGFEVEFNQGRCVVRSQHETLEVSWYREGYGTIETDLLKVAEFEARMELPSDRWMWPEGRPNPVDRIAYRLELTRSNKHRWSEKDESVNAELTSAALGENLVVRFLDLIDRTSAARNRRRDKM
ncbi:MAG: hypothetical protein WCP68_15880 [Enhydrobacter sp.]